MNNRCITNNPMVIEKEYPNTEVVEGNTLSVLLKVKQEVMKGYRLISHPLSSSIRPDISPYKTVLLTNSTDKVDQESLNIIIKAVDYTESLMKNNTRTVMWDDESLNDFQFVDLDITQNLMP